MTARISSGSRRAVRAVEIDQIADHDRQMTALFSLVGKGWWIGTVTFGRCQRYSDCCPQSLDGLEEPFSIAEQDAELFEVAFRQLQEHIGIDGMLSEY